VNSPGETADEVGIELHSEQMLPNAFVSLPEWNQVYLCFLAVLDRMVIPTTVPPESLDARWFALKEFPYSSIWGPGTNIDVASVFKQVKSSRIEFHQPTGSMIRVFGRSDMGK
jgi:hypothetical protein